jgi:aldose 1-epimerase
MEHNNAVIGTYHGEDALWLRWGKYEAVMLPQYGGNLIAFRDLEQGFSFLREPQEGNFEDFISNPGIYGVPVLFPPNRYEDGQFSWRGTVYQLPVNEVATGNHLHGFLHTSAWQLEEFGSLRWKVMLL